MPSSAHILIVRITRLELMISCWMWLVIFKMWLFHSQLSYKIHSGNKQTFLLSASPFGPSSVPGGLWLGSLLVLQANNHSAPVMTRTYLLASPRGHPRQQTQMEKKKKKPKVLPPPSHFCPEGEPSAGGGAAPPPTGLSGKVTPSPMPLSRAERWERRQAAGFPHSDSAKDLLFYVCRFS